jgi:hypothetical protein
MTDRRYFVDVFSDIVDAMRATGTITGSNEVSGTYTLISDNSFNAYESVKINDVDYLITSATSTQFIIQAVTGLDFTGESWQALAPYYIYGHYLEITNRLDLKSRRAVDKFRIWPLIVLILDLKEKHDESVNYIYSLDSISLYIVTPTPDKTATSPTRKETVFEPILYPLYWDLIEKIKESKAVSTPKNLLEHEKYDRYGWGNETAYGNEGLVFNEFLDAIQINTSDIKVYRNTINPGCTGISL